MKQEVFQNSYGVLLLIMLFIIACAKSGDDSIQKYVAKDALLNIEDYQVNFPKTEGYNEFNASCITCHSLRYIEMQPDFPPKTWETIVNKMRKTFGAPIPDTTAAKIVNYLVAVKGKR
jgi:hypothetical protein